MNFHKGVAAEHSWPGGRHLACNAKAPPAGGIDIDFVEKKRLDVIPHDSNWMERHMNKLIWLVGAVVIVLFILGYFGLR